MTRIVLPLATPANVRAITTADVRVAVEIVIHVYVDVVAAPAGTPTPATTPGRTHCYANAKRDSARGNYCSGGIWWVVNRGIGISGSAIHDGRVIRRHVNNLRVLLFNDDHALAFDSLRFDTDLLVGFQCPRVLRLVAHALDGIHHVALLCEKRVTEIRGPLNVVCQSFNYVR